MSNKTENAKAAGDVAQKVGRGLWRHRIATTTVVLTAGVAAAGLLWPLPVLAGLLVAGVGGVGCWRLRPETWRHAERVLRGLWRREVRYGPSWERTMALNGLARQWRGELITPRLVRVRSSRSADVLTIKEAPGLEPMDFRVKASGLAESWRALEVQVHLLRAGRVELEVTTKRHTKPVKPLPVRADVDLRAVPVGRRGDGSPWTLPAKDANVLVAGQISSGKTNVILSLVRGVAEHIHAGSVAVWVADPKGGAGLAHGPIGADGEPTNPLFSRTAVGEAESAQLVLDLANLVAKREDALRRSGLEAHVPSPDDPHLLVGIDELLSITSLAEDRELASRVDRALGRVLSRARACGVSVVGAVQDPREKAVPHKDLWTVKACFAVTRDEVVDVVLGKGAWAEGARADELDPLDGDAGIAYVRDARRRGAPVWVRAAHVPRQVANETAERWPTPWTWTPTRGMHPKTTEPQHEVVDLDNARQQRRDDMDRQPDCATAPPKAVGGAY